MGTRDGNGSGMGGWSGDLGRYYTGSAGDYRGNNIGSPPNRYGIGSGPDVVPPYNGDSTMYYSTFSKFGYGSFD